MTFNPDAFLKNKEKGYRFFQPDSIPSSYINAPRLSRDVYGESISRDELTSSQKVRIFFLGVVFTIVALVAIGLFIG